MYFFFFLCLSYLLLFLLLLKKQNAKVRNLTEKEVFTLLKNPCGTKVYNYLCWRVELQSSPEVSSRTVFAVNSQFLKLK